MPIDCALHDAVGALLQRLAFAPVPVLGLGVQRTLDHLVPHAHESSQFLRIDRVLDDEEAVIVEALQLFGCRCGVGHASRALRDPRSIATPPHLRNANGGSSDATKSSVLIISISLARADRSGFSARAPG